MLNHNKNNQVVVTLPLCEVCGCVGWKVGGGEKERKRLYICMAVRGQPCMVSANNIPLYEFFYFFILCECVHSACFVEISEQLSVVGFFL